MHCVLHGISLPDLGSFEYRLLEAGLERQRAERVSFARLLTHLLGPLSETTKEGVELLLSDYAETVYQVKYNYKYTPAQVRALEQRCAQHQEDARIMAKVDSWTVTGK